MLRWRTEDYCAGVRSIVLATARRAHTTMIDLIIMQAATVDVPSVSLRARQLPTKALSTALIELRCQDADTFDVASFINWRVLARP